MSTDAQSWVTKVQVKEDDEPSVVLTVHLVGFAQGKTVEVYGYISQSNGNYAPFRVSPIVIEPDADGAADIPVIVPADQLELTAGKDVTVVTWASEVWPSMLKAGQPDPGYTAAWRSDDDATNRWPSSAKTTFLAAGPKRAGGYPSNDLEANDLED